VWCVAVLGLSRRLLEFLFLVLLFFIPSFATVLGGFLGFYLTYFVWGFVLALSIHFVAFRRGLGYLDLYSSLSIALAFISLYTFLGFVWGFAARPRLSILSFLSSLALFLVRIVGAEVSRSIAMDLFRKRFAMLLTGVIVGVFFGETIPSLANYVQGFLSSPLPVARDFMYSFVVSLIHLYGGFLPAVTFRAVVDGYWRFSPIVLDIYSLGVLWSAIPMLMYYGAAAYILYGVPVLKGFAKEVFRRRYRKFIDIAFTVILYVLSVSILFSAYMRIVPMVVVSGSMRPALDIGDIVLVDARKPFNVSIGDVIAFRFENMIVVHRVINVTGGGFRTKGDANPDPDPFVVDSSSVVGKVVGSIPKIGLATLALQQGLAIFKISPAALSVVLPVAIVLLALYAWRRRLISRARHSNYGRLF